MKRSFGFKLLFIGCLLIVGPYFLTEFLGVNLNPIRFLINLSYTFGLASITLAAYMIYYKGKRKR